MMKKLVLAAALAAATVGGVSAQAATYVEAGGVDTWGVQLETGWQLLAAGLDINETPAQLLQRQQAIYSSWNTEIAPRFKTLLAQHEPEQLNILLHDDVSYLCQQANNND